jgi:SAM-dependent methyltransferase
MPDTVYDYILGHADAELDRLGRQARLVDPITRAYFAAAGIAPAMRVLDIGSGCGHTAFVAADLVGSTGEVVGTDRSGRAVETARAGAAARGLANVRFLEGDPAMMTFEEPFDALVGRYILVFQPDPAAWLARLTGHVKRGGIVVLHEPDLTLASSAPAVPAYDRCCQLMLEAFGHTNMTRRLRPIFTAAGLPPPAMQLQVLFGGAPDIMPWLQVAGDMAASVVPTMERLGIATAAEVDILRRDMMAIGDSTIIGRSEIGAWARVPPREAA